ncbi:MAG: hypothetical protein ACREBO_13105 [Novosphingobium sp.]
MTPRRAARGQPLLVFALILSTWVGARVAIVTGATEPSAPLALASGNPAPAVAAPDATIPPPVQAIGANAVAVPPEPLHLGWPAPAPLAIDPAPPMLRPVPAELPMAPAVRPGMPVRVAAGHQLLWMAAISLLPAPQEVAAYAAQRQRPPALASASAASHWSGDGWLLWRRGGSGAGGAGFAPSTYGASQVGAVIRYRLAPASEHRPALYLRATSALDAPRGEEAAFGLAARPLPGVPVTALVEARVTRFPGGTRVRPAAALVSELAPFALPARARGEIYLQGGYVGGPGATGFIDGSLRIDRPLLSLGKAELRAGGGVWGGAQKGASRVDIGPGVSLGVPLSDKASARVAADWRFRVAGTAAPTSGPAVTLSAGF